MFTVEQCLAKAVEMDVRAAESDGALVRAEFMAMAVQWRRLADRALIQDRRIAAMDRSDQASPAPVEADGHSGDKPPKRPES